MTTGHCRDGPGTMGRGRGAPCKLTSTPDQTPTGSASVFLNGSRRQAFEQAAIFNAVDVGRDSDTAQILIWDSGSETELNFQVRTTMTCGPDGGLRQKFVQGLAFGRDEDLLDEDGLSGVRELRRGPGGSGLGSDAVRLVLDPDPDSVALTVG